MDFPLGGDHPYRYTPPGQASSVRKDAGGPSTASAQLQTESSWSSPSRHLPHLSGDDALIAVMGVTGSGKSSFIQLLTHEKVGVGHSLESCTQDVQLYQSHVPLKTQQGHLFLVDTPGFDDSHRKDTDILSEIVRFLAESYARKILLTGIIYIHRITDVRLTGASKRNLRMFMKLCGDQGLSNVVLTTTFWDSVSEDVGSNRESELQTKHDFWQPMILQGSKTMRHDGQQESAVDIISYLIHRNRPKPMQVQEEIVNQHLKLDQTAAGQEVDAELKRWKAESEIKMKELEQEYKEALRERDREWQEELAQQRREIQEDMQRNASSMQKLQMDFEALQERLLKAEEGKWKLQRPQTPAVSERASLSKGNLQGQQPEQLHPAPAVLKRPLLSELSAQIQWVEKRRLERDANATRVAFSPDGRLIVVRGMRSVHLWDAETGAEVWRRQCNDGIYPGGLAFSPDGQLIAIASAAAKGAKKSMIRMDQSQTVQLWDVGTGSEVQRLQGHTETVFGIAFSPDGQLVASASRDRTLRLWDVGTGAKVRVLHGHDEGVCGVAFSPDGRLVASGSADRTVRLWDVKTSAVQRLEGHAYPVHGVAFSPDGGLVASASYDMTVRLWDVSTGAEVRRLEGHGYRVYRVAFSPDGQLVASAGDKTVRLWDVGTGTEVQRLEHKYEACDVAWSPDGRLLASVDWTGNRDGGAVVLWARKS